MAIESKKNKKENKHFFKDFKAELKKVIWPTPKQVVNNTIAVITIVLITAIIVLLLDLAFEALNTYGINNLKSVITSNETTIEENSQVEVNNETANNTENIENSEGTENTIENEVVDENQTESP